MSNYKISPILSLADSDSDEEVVQPHRKQPRRGKSVLERLEEEYEDSESEEEGNHSL